MEEAVVQKSGVLFVRPGYKATKGIVKDEPAIVARTLVAERLDELTSLASDVASVPVASAALSHVEATLRRLAGMMAASPGRPVPRGAGT